MCNQKILITNLKINLHLFQTNSSHRINFQLNYPTKILLVIYHSHNIRFQHLINTIIINFSNNNRLHIKILAKIIISNLLLLSINLINSNQFKILMQATKDIKIKVIIMHNKIIIIKVIKKIQNNNITINSITKAMFNTIITTNFKIKIICQTNNINKNKVITISINKMLLQNKINKQALSSLNQVIKLNIRTCKKINWKTKSFQRKLLFQILQHKFLCLFQLLSKLEIKFLLLSFQKVLDKSLQSLKYR